MIKPASGTRLYRIIVRGQCSGLLASLIDNVQIAGSPESGDTCVDALVRDDPEFWGLMEQLQDLALHIVSIQDLDHGHGPASTS